MKATFSQIESVVTPSGNSGHVVVPKDWIGKEASCGTVDKLVLSGIILLLRLSA